ncbi:MAG: hypothetical protein ACXWPM_03140 [Bdellovibrionota bacterium]
MILLLAAMSLVASSGVHADEVKLKVDRTSDDQDTSIVIHKGPPQPQPDTTVRPPDYQIVESTDEIAGEPMPGRDDSYASWKIACDNWKKELKANNPGRLLTSNCGRPHLDSDPVTFKKTQSSTGTYKLKVALHDPIDAPPAAAAPPAAIAPVSASQAPAAAPSGVAAATGGAGK